MQIGFLGLLSLLFIALKLLGFIQWSWIAVTSPLWIGFVLLLSLLTIASFLQICANGNRKKRF